MSRLIYRLHGTKMMSKPLALILFSILLPALTCFGEETKKVASYTTAKPRTKPEIRLPLKQLFSHKAHLESFKGTGVTCGDCHNFSIKSPSFDPLAKNVPAGHLNPERMVCHECHLGKVQLPKANQCSLCHKDPEKLRPMNHDMAWRKRHGAFAQMDPDSCNSCHQENQNSCANCHTQRNTMKPMVHRPNFRLTHSVEARANPTKCAVCHTNLTTCLDCHRGGLRR